MENLKGYIQQENQTKTPMMGPEQASRISNYPKNVNNHCSESWFLLSLMVGERQSRSKKVESD